MPRLNQIIALVKGKKAESASVTTKAYHVCQKPEMFAGLAKTYDSKDEEGEQYPPEEKKLQLRVEEVLSATSKVVSEMFDVVEIQDRGNCEAVADVVVDGNVVLENVPPTYLLFLEKQLVDFATLVSKVPTVDPTKEWHYTDDARCYKSRPIKRTKTKKIVRYYKMSEETELHPAQMDKEHEDIVEGFWSTVEFSGAITEERKHLLLSRTRDLRDAVKVAREEANSGKVEIVPAAGKSVFDFILKEGD